MGETPPPTNPVAQFVLGERARSLTGAGRVGRDQSGLSRKRAPHPDSCARKFGPPEAACASAWERDSLVIFRWEWCHCAHGGVLGGYVGHLGLPRRWGFPVLSPRRLADPSGQGCCEPEVPVSQSLPRVCRRDAPSFPRLRGTNQGDDGLSPGHTRKGGRDSEMSILLLARAAKKRSNTAALYLVGSPARGRAPVRTRFLAGPGRNDMPDAFLDLIEPGHSNPQWRQRPRRGRDSCRQASSRAYGVCRVQQQLRTSYLPLPS